MHQITEWFKRTFADPEVILLVAILTAGFIIVVFMGDMLMPVLASLVIAYLLEGLVSLLERRGVSRSLAVPVVFVLFIIFVSLVLFGVLPLVSRQVSQLVQQLPTMIAEGQRLLMALPQRYPDIFSPDQAQEIVDVVRREIGTYGQQAVSLSLSSVTGLITMLVYLVLMPLLVFFFLKDKDRITSWFTKYLPQDRSFTVKVWSEVHRQIANYVRGKFWEIMIVWAASFAAFTVLGLQYAMLLAVLVGLSVIIPYIGATVVTFPVLLVAWFQWGWGGDFISLTVAYLVIQGLDGNVLVPLLFSEVVNLHPVAIIVAILVFGGVWGFWGVFFAIPLATLVNAILNAWPSHNKPMPETSGD